MEVSAIKAEVPEAALAIGQIRIHCRVIQINDFLAGITLVVFGYRIGQRQCHR
jgi:hypothetical protein